MKPYSKIQGLFKRDTTLKHNPILQGKYSLEEFKYLKDNLWSFTEKVDGTNIRLKFIDGNFSVGGRTDRAQLPAQLVDYLHELMKDKDTTITTVFGEAPTVCLYGEGYGTGIQAAGASYGGPQRFVLFDIRIGHWWLKQEDVASIGKQLGIEVVPMVGVGTLDNAVSLIKGGLKSRWGDFLAEGIVLRPTVELLTRNADRVITKLCSRDFPQSLETHEKER